MTGIITYFLIYISLHHVARDEIYRISSTHETTRLLIKHNNFRQVLQDFVCYKCYNTITNENL